MNSKIDIIFIICAINRSTYMNAIYMLEVNYMVC